MITVKLFEVRDRGTFIPMVAVRMAPDEALPCHACGEPDIDVSLNEELSSCPACHGIGVAGDLRVLAAESYLMRRAGYGAPLVLLSAAGGGSAFYDPLDWGRVTRTRRVAHEYIVRHWDELESGSVVDVEFILGETDVPKRSEMEG